MERKVLIMVEEFVIDWLNNLAFKHLSKRYSFIRSNSFPVFIYTYISSKEFSTLVADRV